MSTTPRHARVLDDSSNVININNPPAMYTYHDTTSNHMAEYKGDRLKQKQQGAF